MTGYDLGDLKILVAEDHRFMRKLLHEILDAFNIRQIDLCKNGAQAIQKVAHFQPDLAIIDLAMEPLSGLEFTRIVRDENKS